MMNEKEIAFKLYRFLSDKTKRRIFGTYGDLLVLTLMEYMPTFAENIARSNPLFKDIEKNKFQNSNKWMTYNMEVK